MVDGWHDKRQRRQVDVVFQRHVAVGIKIAGLFGQVFDFRSPWNGPEILVDQRKRFGRVNIATDGQCRVVGAVPAQEKAFQIVDIGVVEVFKPTDHRPEIGVVLLV